MGRTPFSGTALHIQFAVTMVHMMSMTFVIPGMWTYLKSMGADVKLLGWGLAAFPLGAWLVQRVLATSPLGTIASIGLPSSDGKPGQVHRDTPRTKAYTKTTYVALMVLAIVGNLEYARGGDIGWVIIGRLVAGMGSCGAVLTHKFVEYSTGGDEVAIRSRMVMIGGIQAIGAILGVILALSMASVPDFDLLGFKSTSQQPVAALIVAALYAMLIPGVWMTYDSLVPPKAVIDHVESVKGELDAPPSNFVSSQRLGVLVPALVYDRGQAQPSGQPDVFSTTVILVIYFFMNNLIVGVEVAHGPLCTDLFKWGARDISITYLAFLLAGIIGLLLCLSLSDEVPCNRRLFGAMVMCFVTYGLMLQPSTPKE